VNPQDRQGDIRKITGAGLALNLTLSGFKFAAGIAGSSQAVVADAIHSLTDGVTDILVIAGSYFWEMPPDANHPYGHRRIETLVTISIGAVLLTTGIGIAWQAVRRFYGGPCPSPGWIAALAAGVSIVVKEGLYRWTMRAGKRLGSPALMANAWDHRSDALGSILTLVAVTGAILFPQWAFLDQAGAAVISVFIFQAAVSILWPSLRELLDVAAPEAICTKIKSVCLENSAVRQVHKVRTRYVGMRIYADLHLLVDGSMTVAEGHRVAGEVKNRIFAEVPDLMEVLIHIEPAGAVSGEEVGRL